MDKQTLRRLLLGEFTFKRLVRSIIFIYVFFCLYVFFFADGKIFLPQLSSYSDTSDILKVTTHDQIQLSAVYLPNPASQYTIMYIPLSLSPPDLGIMGVIETDLVSFPRQQVTDNWSV